MDIQARKLNFIQQFLRIKNEEIISKFEEILRNEKYKSLTKPMSEKELIEIIDKAEDDFKNNRLKSADDLKKDVDSWS